MAYYPPNAGGIPQGYPYPGMYPGGVPGGMGNYMQNGYPGGTQYPVLGYPGAMGYPGQLQPGQQYQAQPRPGRVRGGQYGPSYPSYAQMPGQYPAGMPAAMPGMASPGFGAPGLQQRGMAGPGMAAPGMGGHSRRPGFAARMATQQQGTAQNTAVNPSFQAPLAPQPGMGGKGLRLGRRNQAPLQPSITPGMGQSVVSPMGKSIKPKQFNLKPSGAGQGSSGIATINDANTFSLVANNLPDPADFQTNPQVQPPVYVGYLTNRKGQGSFSIGPLHPLGGGTYKAVFQSKVPFYDYDQVMVSLENPYSVGNAPIGPVVLASATGGGISLPKPVSNFFSGTWEKVKGIGKKLGKKKETEPEAEAVPEALPSSLLNGYTLGPPNPITEMISDLPGLGVPAEDPLSGGNP